MSHALHAAGLLARTDRSALASYCRSWARWVKAEKELAGHGEMVHGVNGMLRVSPWRSVAKDAKEMMRTFLRFFGIGGHK